MCVVQTSQWLYILVPVRFIVFHVVPEAHDDCSGDLFDLAVGLGMTGVCRQVLNFQALIHGCKELQDGMCSVIIQVVSQYSIWNDTVVVEYSRHAYQCYYSD